MVAKPAHLLRDTMRITEMHPHFPYRTCGYTPVYILCTVTLSLLCLLHNNRTRKGKKPVDRYHALNPSGLCYLFNYQGTATQPHSGKPPIFNIITDSVDGLCPRIVDVNHTD
jgi:hypothetical protein